MSISYSNFNLNVEGMTDDEHKTILTEMNNKYNNLANHHTTLENNYNDTTTKYSTINNDHDLYLQNNKVSVPQIEGFTDDQLTKIKAEAETSFYYSIESILNKALQLGIYNEYAGSPDFIKQDIANITAVDRADVMRVFEKYIHNKPAIITSFVPKDAADLIVSGSAKAKVIEEVITQGAVPFCSTCLLPFSIYSSIVYLVSLMNWVLSASFFSRSLKDIPIGVSIDCSNA